MCELSSVLKVHIHQLGVTRERLPVYILEELLRQERYRPFLYGDVIVQDTMKLGPWLLREIPVWQHQMYSGKDPLMGTKPLCFPGHQPGHFTLLIRKALTQ